eukprot:Hpha_TRINITY_DN16179_c2_g1::TRINITY_DN16179_c2_g1_i1::g.7929::m.7929
MSEEKPFQDVILFLSDNVGLKLSVREGSTCASLQEALEVFFPRHPSSHWHFAADGAKLAAGDAVPVKLNLCVQQPSSAKPEPPKRQAYSRSQTNPTPPVRPTRKPDATHEKDRSPASDQHPRPVRSGGLRDSSASLPSPPRRAARESSGCLGDVSSLEDARKALGHHLQPADLRRLQKGNSGPVAALMDVVMVALGNTRPTQEAVQRELTDMQFVSRLRKLEPPQDSRVVRRLEEKAEAVSPARHEELRKQGGQGAVALAQWLVVLTQSTKGGHSAPSTKAPHNGVGGDAPDSGRGGAAAAGATRPSRTQKKPAPPPPPVAAPAAPVLSSNIPEDVAAGLTAAVDGLRGQTNAHLRELRSLKAPPALVSQVLSLALTLLGQKDTSWEAAKKALQNTKGFVDMLCLVKVENLPKELTRAQLKAAQKIINDPSMTEDSVAKASEAALAIHRWAVAVWAVFQATGAIEEGEGGAARGGSPAAAPREAPVAREEAGGEAAEQADGAPRPTASRHVMLEQALRSLDSLSAADIREAASYANPPKAVLQCLQFVLQLLGRKDTSWAAGKKFLKDALNELKGVSTEALHRSTSREKRAKLEKDIKDSGLSAEHVGKVSRAATGLFQWVEAVLRLFKVYDSFADDSAAPADGAEGPVETEAPAAEAPVAEAPAAEAPAEEPAEAPAPASADAPTESPAETSPPAQTADPSADAPAEAPAAEAEKADAPPQDPPPPPAEVDASANAVLGLAGAVEQVAAQEAAPQEGEGDFQDEY